MNSKKLPRTNRKIEAERVRLIDQEGEMIGVFSLDEAIRMASAQGADLIEIATGNPYPVCKIGNLGKMKYLLQKKESEERKRNKSHDIKEVKFSINIGVHDYQVKIRHIFGFMEGGYSVKVSCQLRGRDKAHWKERLNELFDRILKDVAEVGLVNGKVSIAENGGDFTLISKLKKQ